MLDDDQARDLLRQAGDTIEVGPGRPVEPVRRRRPLLVALAAAAAVAVAAGSTVALVRGDDTSDPAPDVAGPSVDPDPSAGPEEGRVPVVFGYDEGTARRLLDEAGARSVVTLAAPGCTLPGRALKTEPIAGSRLSESTTVRLTVTSADRDGLCLPPPGDELFWPLLDFARDEGPAPALADEVVSAVQGEVVTVAGASDRSAWPEGSALDALTAIPMLTERTGPDEPARHFGSERDGGAGRVGCPGASAGQDPGLPEGLAGRPSSAIWVRLHAPGEMGPCVVVNIFDRQDVVDAVVVRQLTWQAPEEE